MLRRLLIVVVLVTAASSAAFGDAVPYAGRSVAEIIDDGPSVVASSLSVSVREGQVIIEGAGYRETAEEGERIEFSGGGHPDVFNISRHGDVWEWAEAVAPSVDVDKRTIHDFLTWVSRETGLQLHYKDAAAESAAHMETLTGTVKIPYVERRWLAANR